MSLPAGYGGGSLTSTTSGGGQPISVVTGGGLAYSNNVISASWSGTKSIKLTDATDSSTIIELTGQDVRRLNFLLEVIDQLPNDHPLADLKRDLHMKESEHVLRNNTL